MATNNVKLPNLHIAMYPWFAIGHFLSFLHLANKLAKMGHKISFFVPPKSQSKIASLNHHPDLITFVTVPFPRVNGLPEWAETTNDVPSSSLALLTTAMDLTREPVEALLARLSPDIIFFDLAVWIPALARKYGIKSVYYVVSFIVSHAFLMPKTKNLPTNTTLKEVDLMVPPQGFPDPAIAMRAHEARGVANIFQMEIKGKTVQEALAIGQQECDAMAFRTCREIEGSFCEFVRENDEKPVLLAGLITPGRSSSRLDEEIDGWLKRFGEGTVVYCAFGSECTLEKDHFQELILGLELTGRPFFVALKLPKNCETVESALPKGFLERTKDRGMIHGGWVQQQKILEHPSVGCYVTHCGTGSCIEAMMSKCQIVLFPQAFEQFIHARMMGSYLRLGVEIEKRENDGVFTREAVSKAVDSMMEEESKVGREMRANHAKLREVLSREGFEESYTTEFIQRLRGLLGHE